MRFFTYLSIIFFSYPGFAQNKKSLTYPNSYTRAKNTPQKVDLGQFIPENFESKKWKIATIKTESSIGIPAYTSNAGRYIAAGAIPPGTTIKILAMDQINGTHYYEIENPGNLVNTGKAVVSKTAEIWVSGRYIEEAL